MVPENKTYNGENLTLACKPGYYVQTRDVIRQCSKFKLVPDFELSPAQCLTGSLKKVNNIKIKTNLSMLTLS